MSSNHGARESLEEAFVFSFSAKEPARVSVSNGLMESIDRIERAGKGDPEAVDAWFRAEHPGVYRLCLGFLADPSLAEEIAQDAMLHLLDRLKSYDRKRAFGSWRDTVVLNLCRDRLRRDEARSRAHREWGEMVPQGASERSLDPPPHEVLEAKESHALLMESLKALSPREREVFCLRDLEERSTSQVAEILSVGESTVRSLLTLARRRLRQVLSPHVNLTEEGNS